MSPKKYEWVFARAAFTLMEDGRYVAIGDLGDGRGIIVDIREEKDLPEETTGQVLITGWSEES